MQSSDGSSGSVASSQQGALGTSGGSSSAQSQGGFTTPNAGALEGYLDVGSGDFAKSQAAMRRGENRTTQTVEHVVQRAAAAQQTTAPKGNAAAASSVQSTMDRIVSTRTSPSTLGFGSPASALGLDVSAGPHGLSLHGAGR